MCVLQSARGRSIRLASETKASVDADRREAGALAKLVAQLDERLEEIVDAATDAIFEQNATYEARENDAIRADVALHVREHVTALLESFRDGRETTREDLLFMRRHAAQRVRQLNLADFIHSFHVGQRVLWETTLSLATDDDSRRAALGLVTPIARYFDVAIIHAAEVYLEAEQLLGEAGERARRDALESLLAASALEPAASRAVRDAGLSGQTECLVITATQVGADSDEHTLRAAASSLSRTSRRTDAPLTVVRRGEIVIVAPVRAKGIASLVERVRAARDRLGAQGLELAVGVSTVHPGLDGVADAYLEAVGARDLLVGEPGIVALPTMRALDYLVHSSSPTARRLISADIVQFVAEDTEQGGALLETLRAYVAADMNVKHASEILHVHVNTAHYRLARIAERTGADMRSLGDLVELLVAAQSWIGHGDQAKPV